MTGDKRVTYRRHHSYNTRSNKIRKVISPGGNVTVHYVTKKAKGVKCSDCPTRLNGIPHVRPTTYAKLPKNDRTVSRSYGGVLCPCCLRNRIMRAFIIEEAKQVKKLVQAAGKKA